MKTTKIIGLLCLIISFWSCDNDDEVVVQLEQPTFTITQSEEDTSIYYFENTTPNKDEFYSYWEFEIAGKKYADLAGPVEYQYKVDGDKIVTLTMVSSVDALQTTESISVVVPVDEGFLTNPDNLIVNAYLTEGEGDEFDNWGKYNGGERMSATTDALVGPRAMYVNNGADGNAWDAQFVSDAIETEVGESYTFSVWAKGDPVAIRFSTKPDATAQYGPDYTLTSEWQQYSWTITANEPMTNISLDMGATGGSFVIDAIEAVKGTEALPLPSDDSLVLNGGLEEGEGDEFTNWGKWNGGERMSEETTDVLGGARALYVNNGADGNEWDAQFVSDAVTTEVGVEYEVSLWAKGDACIVRFSTKPDASAQYGPNYTITSDWEQHTWTFTANEPETNISLDMGKSAGSFIIDNIKLVKKE
ncbi:Carbohydrate binding domain-containing protein [Lutibacter oricola]|uniref:Carbohydrate binding domain-containing protein n=1 Tax=Lutibacter oricola TaxID=762486 RepID=A0A1H2VPS0_9FLAO|nr:carbohydrate binding domain-containing protein [Lutibacter oricola]SDW70296.1 Carbohydrate binding domain-containing protein [Lutibacter oricola]